MNKLEEMERVMENYRRALEFAKRHPRQGVIGFGCDYGQTDVYLQYWTWDDFTHLLNGNPLTVQFGKDMAHLETQAEEGVRIRLVTTLDRLPAEIAGQAPRWQETVVIDPEELRDAA